MHGTVLSHEVNHTLKLKERENVRQEHLCMFEANDLV